jgi:hypothetical protein
VLQGGLTISSIKPLLRREGYELVRRKQDYTWVGTQQKGMFLILGWLTDNPKTNIAHYVGVDAERRIIFDRNCPRGSAGFALSPEALRAIFRSPYYPPLVYEIMQVHTTTNL